MMRAIGRGAKCAHGLFALAIATVLRPGPVFRCGSRRTPACARYRRDASTVTGRRTGATASGDAGSG